jgi:hypothetical protein
MAEAIVIVAISVGTAMAGLILGYVINRFLIRPRTVKEIARLKQHEKEWKLAMDEAEASPCEGSP